MNAKDFCCDITLNELCEKAGVSVNEYTSALAVSNKGAHVVLKRKPNEQQFHLQDTAPHHALKNNRKDLPIGREVDRVRGPL